MSVLDYVHLQLHYGIKLLVASLSPERRAGVCLLAGDDGADPWNHGPFL